MGQPHRGGRRPGVLAAAAAVHAGQRADVAAATGHRRRTPDRARPVPHLRPDHVRHIHPGRRRREPGPGRLAVRGPGHAVRGAPALADLPVHRVLRTDGPAARVGHARPDPGRGRCCGCWPSAPGPGTSRSTCRHRNVDGDGLATPILLGRSGPGRPAAQPARRGHVRHDRRGGAVRPAAPRRDGRRVRRRGAGRRPSVHCGQRRAGPVLRRAGGHRRRHPLPPAAAHGRPGLQVTGGQPDREGSALARAAVDRADRGLRRAATRSRGRPRARCPATSGPSPSCSPPRRPSSAC